MVQPLLVAHCRADGQRPIQDLYKILNAWRPLEVKRDLEAPQSFPSARDFAHATYRPVFLCSAGCPLLPVKRESHLSVHRCSPRHLMQPLSVPQPAAASGLGSTLLPVRSIASVPSLSCQHLNSRCPLIFWWEITEGLKFKPSINGS